MSLACPWASWYVNGSIFNVRKHPRLRKIRLPHLKHSYLKLPKKTIRIRGGNFNRVCRKIFEPCLEIRVYFSNIDRSDVIQSVWKDLEENSNMNDFLQIS